MPLPVHLAPHLETERLILRPFEAGDLEALSDLQSRPDVARFLYWEPRTRRETKAALKRKVGWRCIEREGDTLNLAVVVRDGVDGRGAGPMIGDVLLTYTSVTNQQAEIGYLLHPDWQGRGLATEATRAVVDLAFGRLGVHRVFAHLDARNTRSARLAERLGMRQEACLVQSQWVKGEWTDDVVYAVLAGEWPRDGGADRRGDG